MVVFRPMLAWMAMFCLIGYFVGLFHQHRLRGICMGVMIGVFTGACVTILLLPDDLTVSTPSLSAAFIGAVLLLMTTFLVSLQRPGTKRK